jgi:2-polyprenyl-6-methoxyphenol hydroxylase-like FAD-dependent oxidoreductase
VEMWAPSSRVTLLGDAIHTMSPAGGVGAVAALYDSAALAEIIREDGVSQTSIGNYETKMREFSDVCIRRSYRGGGRLLNMPAFETCSLVDI